jgi:hypothetical protein
MTPLLLAYLLKSAGTELEEFTPSHELIAVRSMYWHGTASKEHGRRIPWR